MDGMDERLLNGSSSVFLSEMNLDMINKILERELNVKFGSSEYEYIINTAYRINERMNRTGIEKPTVESQVELMNQRLIKEVAERIKEHFYPSQEIPLKKPISAKDIEKVNQKEFDNLLRERETDDQKFLGGGLYGQEIKKNENKYFTNSTSFATTLSRFNPKIPEEDPTNITGSHSIMTTEPEIVQKARFDLSHQNFIAPDTLYIDSRLRNRTAYPNPHTFSLELENPFTNVYAVRVVSASIPNTQYLINNTNNRIHFREFNSQETSGTYTTASLTNGNYSITDLLTHIQTQMNAVSTSTITLSVNNTTRKITITSDGSGVERFDLVFTLGNEIMADGSTSPVYIDKTVGPILGFYPSNRTGALTYTSNGLYNLYPFYYCLLKIDQLHNFMGVRNTSINGSLTEIPLTSSAFEYTTFSGMSDNLAVHILKLPINRLEKLTFRLLNYDGSSFDTNGFDWSIKLYIYRLDTRNN